MAATFIPNPLVGEEIKHDPLVGRAMGQLAIEGLAVAQRLAPVDTGALRASLHISGAPDGGQRVVVGTDHWSFLEFGTSVMPAQSYLRPIIDALGLHR